MAKLKYTGSTLGKILFELISVSLLHDLRARSSHLLQGNGLPVVVNVESSSSLSVNATQVIKEIFHCKGDA